MVDFSSIYIAGKKVAPIGFGCGPLGVHGFGDVDQAECRNAVVMALDEGVNFFDTSDAYGRGVSEEQLALALGVRRHEAVIATKGGIRFDRNGKVFYDNSPNYLEEALNLSLARLKADYVDLYQLHYWDKKTPIEEVFSCFEAMVKQGRIGAYGVSNLDLSKKDAGFFSEFPNFASHSDELNMVRQHNLNLVKAMKSKRDDIIFLATGVLAQGLLSGKYKAGSSFGENDRRAKSNYSNFNFDFMKRAEPLLAALSGFDVPPVALATAWVIRQSPRIIGLTGVKSRKQLMQVLQARSIMMDQPLWQEMDQEVGRFEITNGRS